MKARCRMNRARAGAVTLTAAISVAATFAAAQSGTPQPTFTRDVAPIFREKCEGCHRPDSMAPMSLVTYEDARPWAASIRARVASRQMPPWHIDKTVGIQRFKNDRSLTDEQIETIVRWVEAGSPKGDPGDMPPAKQWPDESKWQLAAKYGPPELLITPPPDSLPAVGPGVWC